MATTKKIDPETLAREIDDGRGGLQVDDVGYDYASYLGGRLEARGWQPYETHSYCKVASYEAHLRKGNRRVEIIASNFLGRFVEIRCFTVDDD